MIKKFSFFLLLLGTYLSMHTIPLSNPLLHVADQAGLFNNSIVDILKVRLKIKEFVTGKLQWQGAECNLDIIDINNVTVDKKLQVIIKRPEALAGATFVVISPTHPQVLDFVASECKEAVNKFIANILSQNTLFRYEHHTTHGIATGLFVVNPITKEHMPIFIADYILEGFDTRMTHAHVAIPAHDQKDFNFAHAHHLPIKLVINSAQQEKNSSPQFHKTTKQLLAAYPGEYNDCIIVNSDFLNGSIHESHEKALEYLQQTMNANKYTHSYVYHLGHKQYSIQELHRIEMTLSKENKELSSAQKELFKIIMIQAQADFLSIVEQFLVNAKDAKELMMEIIDESMKARNNKDSYLLKWAYMDTNESEKTIFKRDISSFVGLYKFCTELIDFLEDFAYSCPNALATLKNLKH